MNIVEANNQNVYLNPRRFIEKNILPLRVRCAHCDSLLEIDFLSDLGTSSRYSTPDALTLKCLVCYKTSYLMKNKQLDKRSTPQFQLLMDNFVPIAEYIQKTENERRDTEERERREQRERVREAKRRPWRHGIWLLSFILLVAILTSAWYYQEPELLTFLIPLFVGCAFGTMITYSNDDDYYY